MNHTPLRPIRHLALAALTAAAWSASLPAQALARLADVQVIDRDSGETLALHRHQGEHWVAGRPGARYAVSVRNASGQRVMTVVSIDGVNVVSGETAAWDQTGYVLSAWQRHDIIGWRKSDAEVAGFHFTALPDSYAARTGRPDNVGVIGVAVFSEKPGPPVVQPLPRRQRNEAESATADQAERRIAPAGPNTRLGTGHGEREHDRVGHTTFERRSPRPDETIRIRYDSRENLIAMGIITAVPVPPRPNPFPVPVQPRYVPDPS